MQGAGRSIRQGDKEIADWFSGPGWPKKDVGCQLSALGCQPLSAREQKTRDVTWGNSSRFFGCGRRDYGFERIRLTGIDRGENTWLKMELDEWKPFAVSRMFHFEGLGAAEPQPNNLSRRAQRHKRQKDLLGRMMYRNNALNDLRLQSRIQYGGQIELKRGS
jgi:hypothetical protein